MSGQMAAQSISLIPGDTAKSSLALHTDFSEWLVSQIDIVEEMQGTKFIERLHRYHLRTV